MEGSDMKKDKKKKPFVDEKALAYQRRYAEEVLKSFEKMGFQQPRSRGR
tara:strand:- start:200 stop:346 length:147 start_codon:yes stop_codon:yes gene_type:complete